jgi:Flp pilus assembly protein TadD
MILSRARHVRSHARRSPRVAHRVVTTALAKVCSELGRQDEAEKLYGEALAIQSRVLGERHPDTAVTLSRLGHVAALRGERAKALDWLRQAVEHGYRDADSMAKDADLKTLQGDPAFEALVAEARKNPSR